MHNLEMLLLQAPAHSSGTVTDSRKLSELLSQKLVPTKEPNPIKRAAKKFAYFVEDNWKRIWPILLWLGVCVGLFTWKFVQYKNRYVFHVMGYCVSSAKGAGETLKFNMALILLPVCRNTITWLRSRYKFIDTYYKFINVHNSLHLFAFELNCVYFTLLKEFDQYANRLL